MLTTWNNKLYHACLDMHLLDYLGSMVPDNAIILVLALEKRGPKNRQDPRTPNQTITNPFPLLTLAQFITHKIHNRYPTHIFFLLLSLSSLKTTTTP